MAKKQKQHYVSQFVQRPFACDSKQRTIFTFDKATLRSFPQAIRKAAQSSWFYRLDERFGHEEPNFTDDILTHLEGPFAKTFAKILRQLEDGTRVALTEEERVRFVEFLVFQMLRTPYFREQMASSYIEHMKRQALLEKGVSLDEWPDMVMEEETEKVVHAAVMLDPHFIRSNLDYWASGWLTFFEAEKPHYFLTSDAPVNRVSNRFGSDRAPGLGLFFPMSPRFAANVLPTAPSGLIQDLQLFEVGAQIVRKFNRMTIALASRLVLSHQGDFNAARCLLVEDPGIYGLGMRIRTGREFRLELNPPN